MSLFVCPKCACPLEIVERTYRCEHNHCYDMAKEGYMNLLPPNQKNSQNPGDDKQMVAARTAFLGKGYYRPLQQALAKLATTYLEDGSAFLDSGCGEGYYTNEIHRQLKALGKEVSVAGIDISKFAVRHSAKHSLGGEFAVGSAFHLPVGDGSVDVLLNCFSPLCISEFFRVLKPDGVFFYVVPSAKHLWELKEAIYDAPYENQEKVEEYKGFTHIEQCVVTEKVHLPTNADIKHLFGMTPYAWKTGKDDMAKLDKLTALDVTIGFHIHVYEKNR